ncbi:hypothetical protein C3414_03870 [Serratia sp. SSNIH2]|uniref:Uncharacterized protein n=1 Tax=Serratia marcescens TaxID=615 RepID=A0A2F0PGK3_SERMA|nr:hypothetical protein C3F38_18620 [Serratia sp. SSNIH1]OCO74931.1 hypothetical protein AN694_0222935 [Serratia marcescens]POU56361.1 hypothetical protein C3401_03835 [Serratia sp. SSNIH4]POW42802.1 hypothetical protein C3414_03870 [Serratia sp. SSNIH2]POW43312.1 hypothetical protein C3396_01370 [Serratia sp. SSNIH5]POW64678.1 hypothetical protein C3403_01365 [Serratia sp. SSNIH3]
MSHRQRINVEGERLVLTSGNGGADFTVGLWKRGQNLSGTFQCKTGGLHPFTANDHRLAFAQLVPGEAHAIRTHTGEHVIEWDGVTAINRDIK